jgi:hypothetical protein
MVTNANTPAWLNEMLAIELEEEITPVQRPHAVHVVDRSGLDITGVFQMTAEQVQSALAEFKDAA